MLLGAVNPSSISDWFEILVCWIGLNPVLKDLQQGNKKNCQIHTIRSISVWKATQFPVV